MRQYERFTRWNLDYLLEHFTELRAKPGYADALDFVVTELAGVGVSDRDRQLARAAPAVTSMLPLGALETLASAAKLNARTLEINLDICKGLLVDGALPERISEEAYAEACRKASTYDESIELLELALTLGRALVPTVKNRLMGMMLHAMSVPAHATGFGDLQEFFEKGYDTFRGIPDVDYFLEEIERGMTGVFDRVHRSP